MDINDSWYEQLEEHHGADFCVEAGYFQEDLPWTGRKYLRGLPELPINTTVLQFSGAFHPMHEGHVAIIKSAIDAIVERTGVTEGVVVIHVDHAGYRQSKGYFPNKTTEDIVFNIARNEFPYKGFKAAIVMEDWYLNGCSRNFTRLYSELHDNNETVYFLSGGDRANYALTFINKGNCIIAGRDSHPNFEKYKSLANDRLWFLAGNHPASSTEVRMQYANK